MADSTGLSELSAAELAHELNTLPASVDSTLGVYFVPALTGLGAPWWDDSARGVICGLSRGVKRAHLIRAALESITYQIADVVVAMRQHEEFTLTALMVDGGPTNNDWLMQYQADLLGCPVMRSDVPELSAIGAALLARKALHPGSTADLQAFLTEHSTFPATSVYKRAGRSGAMRSTEHYGNRTRQPDRQTARRHAFTYHRRNPAHNDIAIPEYIRGNFRP